MTAVLELPGVAQNEAASTVVDQLEPAVQRRLVAQVRELWAVAPGQRPHAIGGSAMHVKVASAGRLGWWGDGKSYRYLSRQPSPRGMVGAPWPPIPAEWVELWRRFTGRSDEPDTALVNWYPGDDPRASLGWHADRTEHDLSLPIVTVSLGRAVWAVRRKEGAPVSRCTLEPGAVVLLDGPTRLLEHSIERLLDYDDQLTLGVAPPPPPPFAPHPPPVDNGRLSITLRIAGDPAAAAERAPAVERPSEPQGPPLSWEQLAALSAEATEGLRPVNARRWTFVQPALAPRETSGKGKAP
jgi:alkylated DNA repair protein (DNA oxidative demethylase)